MDNREHARRFTDHLGLENPPVALAFADTAPQGVATGGAAVPSTCAFWRRAETGVFFAPAEAHFNCPVGAMVMGFDLPKAISDELMQLVGTMTKCGYIRSDEPGAIPTSPKKAAKGIVYGPLAQFPVAPDAVLFWLTPANAMVLSEAREGAAWGGSAPATVFGRPACAAIPKAMTAANTTLSLGCIGIRTFTGITEDLMLAVVPGTQVAEAAERVQRLRGINDRMEDFYRARAQRL